MKLKMIFKFLKPKYLWLHAKGICPVCSHRTFFLFTDKQELIRNHAVCVRCGSVSRHRGVAVCVLQEFSKKGIARLSDFRLFPTINILNTSSGSPVARALGSAPNIFNTEYFDDCPSGRFKNGVLCQDLENLSFDSNHFDAVLTEDVFEHVKDLRQGFSEVHRVLKRGGLHIFTIPFFFAEKTRDLFAHQGNDYVPVVQPVEYHGDGIRGKIPAYHYIGYDMFDRLSEIGFDTRVHFSEFHEYSKYGTFNCFTFISRKK
jgi:SAM-dependent methyltransferase